MSFLVKILLVSDTSHSLRHQHDVPEVTLRNLSDKLPNTQAICHSKFLFGLSDKLLMSRAVHFFVTMTWLDSLFLLQSPFSTTKAACHMLYRFSDYKYIKTDMENRETDKSRKGINKYKLDYENNIWIKCKYSYKIWKTIWT